MLRIVARAGLLVLMAGCVACGGRSTPPRAPLSRPELVFFEDFTGPSLDRSRWNVEVTGQWVNDEQQAYVDDSTTVFLEDGALVLEARPRKGYLTAQGRKFDFVSGRINTRGKFEFSYGTVSARMKLPEGSGFWPAFWLLGKGRWPDTGEIDVMESDGELDWVSSALHGPGYSGATPLVNQGYFPRGADITGWHVYSVDWSPTELVFRVDDAVHFRVSRPMVEHYGRWAYDEPKFIILNLALGGGFPRKYNDVAAPYPGLPTSTVQRIEEGRSRVLVDWVKVTRK